MRTVRTEFPDYDGELPSIPGYTDTSWHNDACPSIGRDYGDGVRVRVWCDYVDPEKRECPESKRFAIAAYSPTDEDGTVMLDTDSISLVIERICQYEASMSIPPLELAIEFCRQLSKNLDDGTIQLINARNQSYEAAGDHSTCATHDFCDANQVMLDAIEAICVVADYHFAQNAMINAAWDIARRARFDTDKCEQSARAMLDDIERKGTDTGLGGPLSDLRDELATELHAACKAAENWLSEYETGPDSGVHGLLQQLREAMAFRPQELLVLVYQDTRQPRDSGYGELMVFRQLDAADRAIAELAKIGVFVDAVPLATL